MESFAPFRRDRKRTLIDGSLLGRRWSSFAGARVLAAEAAPSSDVVVVAGTGRGPDLKLSSRPSAAAVTRVESSVCGVDPAMSWLLRLFWVFRLIKS